MEKIYLQNAGLFDKNSLTFIKPDGSKETITLEENAKGEKVIPEKYSQTLKDLYRLLKLSYNKARISPNAQKSYFQLLCNDIKENKSEDLNRHINELGVEGEMMLLNKKNRACWSFRH